jgi:hypothetical protein
VYSTSGVKPCRQGRPKYSERNQPQCHLPRLLLLVLVVLLLLLLVLVVVVVLVLLL